MLHTLHGQIWVSDRLEVPYLGLQPKALGCNKHAEIDRVHPEPVPDQLNLYIPGYRHAKYYVFISIKDGVII